MTDMLVDEQEQEINRLQEQLHDAKGLAEAYQAAAAELGPMNALYKKTKADRDEWHEQAVAEGRAKLKYRKELAEAIAAKNAAHNRIAELEQAIKGEFDRGVAWASGKVLAEIGPVTVTATDPRNQRQAEHLQHYLDSLREDAESAHEGAGVSPMHTAGQPTPPRCQAGRDGDCNWAKCPQRDDRKRHCPLDVDEER
jgi:DNA repair exonuclease SbcCD ATPase subunit